jgi:SAM-dependent methyltransferase
MIADRAARTLGYALEVPQIHELRCAAMDARLQREREFHDRAFAEDVRASAKRFYAVNRSMLAWYEGALAERAEGARVLEYGCGPGSRAFHLARHGARVVGIDISPVAIEQASARGRAEGLEQQLDFRVMDAERLELDDDSFDVVCGSGILHHLSLARAYREIARVLVDDGVAIFTEPLGHNPAINAYRNRTPELRTVDEHPLLARDLTLAESFFAQVVTRFFTLTSLLAVPVRGRPGFDRLVAGLDAVDRSIFRLVPPLRRQAWMVGLTLSRPRALEPVAER